MTSPLQAQALAATVNVEVGATAEPQAARAMIRAPATARWRRVAIEFLEGGS